MSGAITFTATAKQGCSFNEQQTPLDYVVVTDKKTGCSVTVRDGSVKAGDTVTVTVTVTRGRK